MKITIDEEEIVPEIYSLYLSELASLIYFLNDYIDRLKEAECTKDEIKEVERIKDKLGDMWKLHVRIEWRRDIMSIILIPCLKFLINLVIVCATINISFYILAISYSILVAFLFDFLYGVKSKTLDNTEENDDEN